MMRYQVEFDRKADKAMDAIRDRRTAEHLRAAIMALADAPRPPGCRKLVGRDEQWRIRVGDWRVIYRIDDGRLVVMVVEVGTRGEVYR